MSQEVNFRAVTFSDVYVNDNTTWTFAEFTDDSGLTATVEITSGDHTVETIKLLSEAVVSIVTHRLFKKTGKVVLRHFLPMMHARNSHHRQIGKIAVHALQ